ncbi:hypothetical protein GCM10025868_22410 [Angustibacter aerolatus]|uniref:ABC transmembrane type-1 domain-containing protein n=1 Tax=Angustibacter aerolatus TaxID=1162965 RepID=A0ABQ6JJM2_9ACTN|nr:hypothetical protein [Angustibacter aerolatus]GMA86991.1 hypothetical protein GCM10025868_22410 [Angustibacter aerolatus]
MTSLATPTGTGATASAPVRRGRPARSSGPDVGRPSVVWALPATLFFTVFAIVPLVLVAVLSFVAWAGSARRSGWACRTGRRSCTTR